MCLGVPMQVAEVEAGRARCLNGDESEWVDMSLLGEQPVGSWVLVFLGAAREVLDATRAAQMRDALRAVEAVMAGQEADLDSLFADLAGREPQLPPHLQAQIDHKK
jgi:hydrogenase expression/formation protein HypC